MFNKLYVKDNRFNYKDPLKGRFKRSAFIITALLLAIAVIFATACFVWELSVGSRMNKLTGEYLEYIDDSNFIQAMEIYRKAKKDTLDRKHLAFTQNKMEQTLKYLEEDISERIIKAEIRIESDNAILTEKEIEMLEAFSEISVRETVIYYKNLLDMLISGRINIDKVYHVTGQLMRVNVLEEKIEGYSEQIEHIRDFSDTVIGINNKITEQDYFNALKSIEPYVSSEYGFVKEYITNLFIDIKKEALPEFIKNTESLMERNKHFSAIDYLDKISVYYPGEQNLDDLNDSLKNYREINLVKHAGPIEHIAIRPLISTPGFDFSKNDITRAAEDLMLTAAEFRKILEELFINEYILIDIGALIDENNDFKGIYIPENKKPLILSVEGLNYYSSRRLTGNSINLDIDKDGNIISSYYDEKGNIVSDTNGEAIGILEDFIEEHPEFSFDGAKGNISLTGFECVFGYIVDEDQIDDRAENFKTYGLGEIPGADLNIDKNKDKAKEIIETLKKSGWTFSSSTYGNISVGETSLEKLKTDTDKWMDQVGSLIGETEVILFPNGSVVSSSDERGDFLIEEGFVIHCGIGPKAYFNFSERNMFMDRLALNGISMRTIDLSRFFDVHKVYDANRTKRIGGE